MDDEIFKNLAMLLIGSQRGIAWSDCWLHKVIASVKRQLFYTKMPNNDIFGFENFAKSFNEWARGTLFSENNGMVIQVKQQHPNVTSLHVDAVWHRIMMIKNKQGNQVAVCF